MEYKYLLKNLAARLTEVTADVLNDALVGRVRAFPAGGSALAGLVQRVAFFDYTNNMPEFFATNLHLLAVIEFALESLYVVAFPSLEPAIPCII